MRNSILFLRHISQTKVNQLNVTTIIYYRLRCDTQISFIIYYYLRSLFSSVSFSCVFCASLYGELFFISKSCYVRMQFAHEHIQSTDYRHTQLTHKLYSCDSLLLLLLTIYGSHSAYLNVPFKVLNTHR